MKKILALFVLIIIVIGSLFLILGNPCNGYSCLDFKNKESFKETEQIENTQASYRGLLTKGDIRIRLEAYSAASQKIAEGFTQTKVMLLQGLFETVRSPYPGVLSNEIVCEERFKPTTKEIIIGGAKATVVTGFLNDRLQYGSCLESQLTFTGKTAMFYCDTQKKWYYFETISKRGENGLDLETTHLIQSLKCQKSF